MKRVRPLSLTEFPHASPNPTAESFIAVATAFPWDNRQPGGGWPFSMNWNCVLDEGAEKIGSAPSEAKHPEAEAQSTFRAIKSRTTFGVGGILRFAILAFRQPRGADCAALGHWAFLEFRP